MPANNPEHIEDQIRENRKIVDYSIREYPIEVLVDKYLKNIEEGKNEIFVPDYQRNFVWPESNQSRFIESVLIGLPIPYLFVADAGGDDDDLGGRLEIVDGTQRIRTLAAFIQGDLELTELKKLPLLNGSKFANLNKSRQRRFMRTTIRLIELTEDADEETRRDMFDRINTGGKDLNAMETRRGTTPGPFMAFVERLAKDNRLRTLAPLSADSTKRRDYEELVARFFAYRSNYEGFKRKVVDFVNEFVGEMAESFDGTTEKEFEKAWDQMISFVERNFESGFQRPDRKSTRTPRVRFESLSVGVALALAQRPKLVSAKVDVTDWIGSEEFNSLVTSDGSNNRTRIIKRIEYVRDKILATP